MTALHNAASQASASIVEFLVAHGAEINARTNANMTPLHYAVGYAPMGDGAVKTVKFLLSKGADKRAMFQGQTLEQYAARANRPQMAEILRKSGAK
jgi:ankyrin repeat protein